MVLHNIGLPYLLASFFWSGSDLCNYCVRNYSSTKNATKFMCKQIMLDEYHKGMSVQECSIRARKALLGIKEYMMCPCRSPLNI